MIPLFVALGSLGYEGVCCIQLLFFQQTVPLIGLFAHLLCSAKVAEQWIRKKSMWELVTGVNRLALPSLILTTSFRFHEFHVFGMTTIVDTLRFLQQGWYFTYISNISHFFESRKLLRTEMVKDITPRVQESTWCGASCELDQYQTSTRRLFSAQHSL